MNPYEPPGSSELMASLSEESHAKNDRQKIRFRMLLAAWVAAVGLAGLGIHLFIILGLAWFPFGGLSIGSDFESYEKQYLLKLLVLIPVLILPLPFLTRQLFKVLSFRAKAAILIMVAAVGIGVILVDTGVSNQCHSGFGQGTDHCHTLVEIWTHMH